MPEYYHASKVPLDLGAALKSTFINPAAPDFQAVDSALRERDKEAILKSLLLTSHIARARPTVFSGVPFALKEIMLERIRRNEFPHRPSRIHCVYVCPSRDNIVAFRELVRKDNDRPHLYLCSLSADTVVFEADMRYVESANPLAPIAEQLDYLTYRSRLYWQGQKSDQPMLELLAPAGSVEIAAIADW